MNDSFELSDLFESIFKRWWILVIGAIIGGLLGFGWTQIRPPLYESSAVLEVGIDYGRTSEMDPIVQQHALDRVRALLLSDATLNAAIERVEAENPIYGGALKTTDVRESIRIGEKGSSWELQYRDVDPELTALFANAWAESGLELLDVAIQHSWRAQELQDVFYQVGCTLTLVEEVDGINALWDCVETEPEVDLDTFAKETQREAILSRGILPALSYSLSQSAEIPENPSARGSGSIVLAGALIGVLIGALVAIANAGSAAGKSA